ncbi:MAG: BrnA antitoxin family protein [Gammaproteobacteria bacterium]|nr:BrnA antitoxin family protein [Gammaproteobacteria bacterium]
MKKDTKKKPRPLTNRDGEVRELTLEDFRKFRPAKEVLPPELWTAIQEHKKSIGQRGPQKKPKKISVTVRYSAEVVDYFKATGDGWQAKMDEALKEWIKKHKRPA